MQPIIIEKNKSQITSTMGFDEVVYDGDVNKLVENSGLTVKNIIFPITNSFYIKLADVGSSFVCGNIIQNLNLELKKNNINNSIIVIDFEGIEKLSENFYRTYAKILLETSNKIITINMNTQITNEFGFFVNENILSEVEE